jgi:hypothetical protein
MEEVWAEFVQRMFGPNLGAGGGRRGENVRAPNSGFGPRLQSALERGELILNEDDTLSPGPNYNENDAVITGIMNRVNTLIQESTDPEGPPEPPPTDIVEPEPEPPEQQTISLEDFETQFEDVEITEEIVESGTYTDPETGIVYVINFPPDYVPPSAGGGGGGALAAWVTAGGS